MKAFDAHQMNRRVEARRAVVASTPRIPVRGPSWAGEVVETGGELVAIHSETAAPYPLDLHHDLDPEACAIVVGRRILAAGGTPAEVRRFLNAFDLPPFTTARLTRLLDEGAP